MNDEKRPGDLDQDSQDDLDAFARALLNRKTEMRIFRDENSDEVEIGFSDNEREAAERTMSQALDTLRKSRGQKTIEEEETAFWLDEQPQEETNLPQAEQETQGRRVREPKPVKKSGRKKARSSRKPAEEARKREKPASEKKRNREKKDRQTAPDAAVRLPSRLEKTREKEEKPPRPAKTAKTRNPKRRRLVLFILTLCLLSAAGLGVYCWKVLVWNPENLTTETQEASYKKLVDYADEYGSGLMSDAEKAEILDLKGDYDSLAPRQKKEIDAYFAEQTRSGEYPNGRSFTEIWEEQSQLKQSQEDAAQPQFQELTAYLANWNEKSDEEKRQIVNYKEYYKGLTQQLKNQVDEQLKAATGKTFSQLVSEQEEALRSQQVEYQQQIETQKAELQAQIDSLNQELESYTSYGTSLNEELNEERIAGGDTSEIEAQITANNAYIQDLQSQIQSLEYQRDSLQ